MTTVVISPVVIGSAVDNDANRGAIGYESIAPDSTITASTEATGYEAANVADGLTWDFWRPLDGDTAAWIAFDYGSLVSVDYVGIAVHNLGSIGASVTVQAYIGGMWQDVHEFTPTSDAPLMALFEALEAQEWRLVLSGYTAYDTPSIGVVNIGTAMRFQRNIYVGHTPITMGRNTNIKPNLSNTGQFLGRSVERRGAQTNIALNNLTPDWYRETFEPFAQYAITGAFFWMWRPDDYPEEVGYVWTTTDIIPSNQRNNGMMSVSFKVEGITT